MTKTPIALLLFGLMAAAPVWSQTLTPDAEAALGSALQDERHAEAFYSAVMAKFGDARPFWPNHDEGSPYEHVERWEH
jgi:hypothetical protein